MSRIELIKRMESVQSLASSPNYSMSAAGTSFSFVSTGTQYVGRASTASGTPTVYWTIEGTQYANINPGTVVFAGDKTVNFFIDPALALTVININTNTLTGQLPNLDSYKNLGAITCYTNALSGAFPSLRYNTALYAVDATTNAFTGSIPSITTCFGMQFFQIGVNQFSGSIPNISANTSLVTYYCNNNLLSGDIPTLSSNVNMTTFRANSNSLTGVTAGFAVAPALHAFYMHDNLLTQAAVDAILAAFVAAGATGAYTINVGGTGNATPSAAGLADKATLQGLGWTVTTN